MTAASAPGGPLIVLDMAEKGWTRGGGCGSRGSPAMGRAAILKGAPEPSKPGRKRRHYKPVSVEEGLPDAPPAIPGECTVQQSWRYTSNAPVAYQMQQIMHIKEDQKEEQRYPGSSHKNEADALWSWTQANTTTLSLDKVGKNVQGSDTSKNDKKDGSVLWEPCCVNHLPPDIASVDEFPSMKPNPPPKATSK